MPRGRPPSDLTVEEREQRLREARARSKLKSRNVTMDNEVAEKIGLYQEALSKKVGFKVTVSQALSHALRHLEFPDD
jgi:hypothetical protein